MPHQSWPHRHPPLCLFISSHMSIIHPSTIPPSNYLSVHLFICSSTTIHPSTTLLSFTYHSSSHHPTITIHPLIHPPFIYLLIHPSTHHPPILPLSTHPSTIPLSICRPSIHSSPIHGCMHPSILAFLHPPSIHLSFIYLFITRSLRNLT